MRGLQHTRMFNRRNPNLRIRRQRLREMMHHQIGRFRRARSPNNIQRPTPQKPRQLLPRIRQRLLRPRPQPMRARRIPHQPLTRLHPSLPRDRAQRRRGIVVEINHADGQDTHRPLAFEFFVACLTRWFQKPSRHRWHQKTKHSCSSASISRRVCRWIVFTAPRIFGREK